jgi:hypothetical protein
MILGFYLTCLRTWFEIEAVHIILNDLESAKLTRTTDRS